MQEKMAASALRPADRTRRTVVVARQRSSRVAASSAAKLVHALVEAGADAALLLLEAGIDAQALDRPEATIDDAALQRLYHLAAARLGGDLGLRLAARVPLEAFGVLAILARRSRDVGEGLARMVRFYSLWSESGAFELRNEDEGLVLSYAIPGMAAEDYAQDAEFTLGIVVRALVELAGEAARPVRVEFAHRESTNREPMTNVFGVPVRFGTGRNALVLAPETADLPVCPHTGEVDDVLLRYAEERLASQGRTSLAVRVRNLAEEDLELTLSKAADHLGQSARTLQRSLAEEGESFVRLLNRVRHVQSLRLLRDPSLELTAVAYRLGFSEVSAFVRAFRRWEGTTPGAYRARL